MTGNVINQVNKTCGETARQLLIPEAKARVEKALDNLAVQVGRLYERLQSVSGIPEAVPTQGVKQVPTPNCPMADWATEIAAQITNNVMRLESIIEHLEI